MSVVVDTNILVSAMLRGGIPARVIAAIVGRDDIRWVLVPELLAEYLTVIRRPRLPVDDDARRAWTEPVLA